MMRRGNFWQWVLMGVALCTMIVGPMDVVRADDRSTRLSAPDPGTVFGFSEGRAAFQIGQKYGYIDRTGTVVIPARYDEALEFLDGLAIVRQGEGWGAIDPAGNTVVPFMYDALRR